MKTNTAPALDPKAFRAALGSFATGVTVITTRAADGSRVENGFKTNRGGDNFLATGRATGTTMVGMMV